MPIRILAVLLLGLSSLSRGQTDIYEPYRNHHLWRADTLYLGAGFARLSTEPVKIWLIGNEAGWEGQLFFVDPATGNEIQLFRNHEAAGRVVTITDFINVPIGQTLTFVYKVVGRGSGKDIDVGDIRAPRYTGPNRRGSRYFSQASSDDNVNPARRFGHRWSVAGRVDSKTLEFGFEDDDTPDSDMDFDDIVYGVEGLTLVTFERTAKIRSYVW